GHEYLGGCLSHQPQKRTILHSCPPSLLRRGNIVLGEVSLERSRGTLVEDDPHSGPTRSRGVSARQQHLLRELEDGHRLLTLHARKMIEELVERMATLQILDECLHWHTRTHEHRRSAHDLGIAVNRWFSRRHWLL